MITAWKLPLVGLVFLATARGVAWAADTAGVPAFPGALGFAARATGGRGGSVYHVTHLNDSGPGSFRDAVSRPHRMVVFDVAGWIDLKSAVQVASDITIAGQSAPGDGIGIKTHEVSFEKASNVIVRYMRFRPGLTPGTQKKYVLGMGHVSNVIVDHCSIEWGRWDCIGMSDSKDVTIQYCIIGESIDPQRFGCLCESDNVTFSHNLWIDNQSRNPKAKGSIEYVNNVVYNWGVAGLVGGHSAEDHTLNAINNYFIAGPNSRGRFTGEYTETDKVYQSGNLVDTDKDGTLKGAPAQESSFGGSDGHRPTFASQPTVKAAAWAEPPDTAEVAFQKVIAGAGCSLHRDAIDQRLIDDVKSLGKSGKIIDDPAEVGGINELATGKPPTGITGDGIPDDWKTAHGLNPKLADDGKPDSTGYTNLEKYLNNLVTAR
jgi:pectate lyase